MINSDVYCKWLEVGYMEDKQKETREYLYNKVCSQLNITVVEFDNFEKELASIISKYTSVIGEVYNPLKFTLLTLTFITQLKKKLFSADLKISSELEF